MRPFVLSAVHQGPRLAQIHSLRGAGPAATLPQPPPASSASQPHDRPLPSTWLSSLSHRSWHRCLGWPPASLWTHPHLHRATPTGTRRRGTRCTSGRWFCHGRCRSSSSTHRHRSPDPFQGASLRSSPARRGTRHTGGRRTESDGGHLAAVAGHQQHAAHRCHPQQGRRHPHALCFVAPAPTCTSATRRSRIQRTVFDQHFETEIFETWRRTHVQRSVYLRRRFRCGSSARCCTQSQTWPRSIWCSWSRGFCPPLG